MHARCCVYTCPALRAAENVAPIRPRLPGKMWLQCDGVRSRRFDDMWCRWRTLLCRANMPVVVQKATKHSQHCHVCINFFCVPCDFVPISHILCGCETSTPCDGVAEIKEHRYGGSSQTGPYVETTDSSKIPNGNAPPACY